MTAKFFNHILQGHEATPKNAADHARGLDWQEIETENQSFDFLTFEDSINGVDIYYNYGCNSYYFADATEEENN